MSRDVDENFHPVEVGVKHDGGKPRADLLLDLSGALLEVAKVLDYGAVKYAPGNWKRVEDREARYSAAMMRHLLAYGRGEVDDPETGLPHLAHLACNILFLLEIEKE
jgi:hypothetical protein